MKAYEFFNRKRIQEKYKMKSNCTFLGIKEDQDINEIFLRFINDVISYDCNLNYIKKVDLKITLSINF